MERKMDNIALELNIWLQKICIVRVNIYERFNKNNACQLTTSEIYKIKYSIK